MYKIFILGLLAMTMQLVTMAGSVTARQSPAKGDKTVWAGVYATTQATSGKDAFVIYCSGCHRQDLSGGENPPLKGNVFLGHWLEDSLSPLFSKMKKMPPSGEKPSEQLYLDILAHILERNGFPAGAEELSSEALPNIMVTGKDGPGPVPGFALVHTVGCLTPGAAGVWTLTLATEPLRTRNPDAPTAEELQQSKASMPASHTFVLLSPSSFKPGFQIESYTGHKIQAKGLLIRTPNDDRLNVTWLEPLATNCP